MSETVTMTREEQQDLLEKLQAVQAINRAKEHKYVLMQEDVVSALAGSIQGHRDLEQLIKRLLSSEGAPEIESQIVETVDRLTADLTTLHDKIENLLPDD